MKTCPRCEKSKDAEKDFAKKRGGKQPFCKACQSDYQKVYYRENKAAQIARCSKRRDEQENRNQRHLIEYLQTHPCVDCGETDITVLQFDHVRGEKKAELCRMVSSGSTWNSLLKEIAKCEVRCANDHARKTAKAQNNYKFQWAASVKVAQQALNLSRDGA
jgi:hypothetical protein